MSKLDYEKDHRKRKSKVRVVKKPGAITDFAGEDQQDKLVAVVPALSKYKPGQWNEERFTKVKNFLKQKNNGSFAKLSDDKKREFLRDFCLVHAEIKLSVVDEYKKSAEFREAERFFQSYLHLIDPVLRRKYLLI